MVMFFLILALVFVVLLVIITNIVIVPQSKVYVVERLGSYSDTWSAGLHIKIPFIERIAKGEPEGAGSRLSPSAGHHPR